ncbi:helix-turn-helix transcriptional regulator [Streptomyces triculaminicus]|uniref:helix-turn-helix transcriptional regulator n=1 Tax=Streptomyces triculaminicus TaxID=2816232 RepID=UPI0033FE1095
MERDWTRLGRAIAKARDERGLTQKALAQAADVARQTVRSLEAGEPRKRIPPTLSKIETALGWPAGHARQLLDQPEPTERASYAEGMPLRIIQELGEGQVLDTEVLDLTRPGSNSRLVVVFKRDAPAADADPAQLAAEIEEWTRVQREMRRITSRDPNAEGA